MVFVSVLVFLLLLLFCVVFVCCLLSCVLILILFKLSFSFLFPIFVCDFVSAIARFFWHGSDMFLCCLFVVFSVFVLLCFC